MITGKLALGIVSFLLSFCLFSSLVALLLFHPEETARRLGLYGLVIWMGNYSFELARWIKGSDKN